MSTTTLKGISMSLPYCPVTGKNLHNSAKIPTDEEKLMILKELLKEGEDSPSRVFNGKKILDKIHAKYLCLTS
jgi:hypothetical protein